MRFLRWLPALGILCLAPGPFAQVAPASRTGGAQAPVRVDSAEYRGATYVVAEIDPSRVQIRTYWRETGQQAFGNLTRLQTWLSRRRERLLVGMNGGMYDPSRAPKGLLVDGVGGSGHGLSRCAPGEGGSYCLPPNGVFYVARDGTPGIIRSDQVTDALIGTLAAATQSGPILIENGQLTQHFQSADTLPPWTGAREQYAREFAPRRFLFTRNAVCLGPGGRLFFIKTDDAVRLDPFARHLRDEVRCQTALYLDGAVSALHVPGVHEDPGSGLVTLIGVTARS